MPAGLPSTSIWNQIRPMQVGRMSAHHRNPFDHLSESVHDGVVQRGDAVAVRGIRVCPVLQQIAKALIGVFRCAEAGELTHRPEAPPMHGGMNAAGVGRLTREAQFAVGIPAGEISGRIKPADGISGNGGEFRLALGAFFESEAKRVFLPGGFLRRRLAWGGWSVGGYR